ncbi:Prostaglandin reductase 1 [Cyberlindnera fabianii]|uniref:Prostaglandin reductase 1 n=1 Tax=Cyberlindnera fabianii TaxID=36022 RepID=A0A1V2LBC9_CYBFA|nr:Prostaglandin reductase 1 [Cyberlindnera fabianii]
MVRIEAKQWILVKYANFVHNVNLNYNSPDTNFKLITKVYDTEDPNLLKEGELLIESSVAPAQGLARVIKSNHSRFNTGDIITNRLVGWSTHNIINADRELTIKPDEEGKIWLITGAAGAAGSSLVQIVANIFKPKLIIAVAGGDNKCKWVETLGKNVVCLDYKSKTYKKDFSKALGKEQIDVFADHVGGWLLEHALPHVRNHGKVVQVGIIATYNDSAKFTFSSYGAIITKRITIQGMVVVDHVKEYKKAYKDLAKWFAEGKLNINNFEETIVDAKGDKFKQVPELWTGLFKGQNKGKYITQVGDFRTLKFLMILLKDGEVLVENLYLSNDPAQKGWFTPYKSYIPPVPLGSVAPAQGLGRVIKSKSDKFAEGDLISARSIGWSTHNIINADAPMVQKPDASKVPHITKYLSAFGTTTLTAYFTAFHYSGIKPEDEGKVWLISGAAGAAGSSLMISTKALGDDLINVFADHVGGWILNHHAISYMQTFGKIVQIGLIASYNDDTSFTFNNYSNVISKRLTIQGMVLVDHIPEIPTVVGELIKYFSTGKLDINNFTETIVDAQGDKFKDVPKLWTGLFTGANRGKFITQVGKY